VQAGHAGPAEVSARRIAGLALPALVVLAAEPLYVLVDTAVVGHLGRTALDALAIGGVVLTVAAWFGGVLAYGTTGRAARRYGAGDRAAAVAEGVQASWLAIGVGLVILVLAEAFAGPVAGLLAGGDPAISGPASQWLRIAALGAPGLLLATSGQGWLRGIQDTRRPLYFVLAANLLSAALCPLLVYPLGLGLSGSAVANAVAQTLSGVLFLSALVRERVALRPRPAVIRAQVTFGRDLVLRGAAFQLCFLSATAVVARFGSAALAAHQIALQLWFFTALVLDALAIAAQALVGAALGGHDAAGARSLARRVGWAGLVCGAIFAVLIGALAVVLPRMFSHDPAVLAQCRVAWPYFVGMLPFAGLVFALDGVFVGAGDVAFLRNMTIVAALGGFLPAIWLAYALDLGLGGVWAGLSLFIAVRLVALLLRLRGDAWAVVGATR
jgi:putative MATE family efflux protein